MRKINYQIKTNRVFTLVRKYGWIFTLVVAIGGLWVPKLGLLVILIMAGLMITSFFTGRYWCGNFCPHGSLFDSVLLPVSLNKKIPNFLKSKFMIIGFFMFFMYNFSRRVISTFNSWGTLDFFDNLGFVFVITYLIVMIVGSTLSVFITPRTWCQFCPMGSIQKLSYKLGTLFKITKRTNKKITIADKNLCHLCGKCSRVCPFQLKPYLEFSNKNQFNNINCIKCSTCVKNCPAGILSLSTEKDIKKTSLEGYKNKKKIIAKVKNINYLKDDVIEYTFNFISPKNVTYKAGQFILIKIEDNPISYRAYSISSYNDNNNELSVIIKIIKNGYGTNIIFNNFKVGDTVELIGPMGNELIPDKKAKKILLVGNGIGITPFVGLTKDILVNQPKINEVKLLYGERYENDFIYDNYFKTLEKEYPKFQYIPVTSRSQSNNVRKGYVTDVLNEINLDEYKVYMCGTKQMINDSYELLIKKGVKDENIFYESQ